MFEIITPLTVPFGAKKIALGYEELRYKRLKDF